MPEDENNFHKPNIDENNCQLTQNYLKEWNDRVESNE
jgi:hypothetical protein